MENNTEKQQVWAISEFSRNIVVNNELQLVISVCNEAAARFIVTACNSHTRLLKENGELKQEIQSLKEEIASLDSIIKNF